MPEAAAYAIEYAAAALETEMVLTAGQIYSIAQGITAVAAVYGMREQQRRAAGAQRDAYNSSLRDRYVAVRSATEPRAVVLGRQRVAGPVVYVGSYGTQKQNLVFAMALAGHEIDAVEAIYFDDERVVVDGSGNVLGINRRDLFTLTTTGATFTLSSAPKAGTVVAEVAYGSTIVSLGTTVVGDTVAVTGGTSGQTGTVTITYQPDASPYINTSPVLSSASITLTFGGNGSVVLPDTPEPGSVHVVTAGSGGSEGADPDVDISAYASISGNTITVTGAPLSPGVVGVTYYTAAARYRARVRIYLGAAGQTADAGMLAALPGVWTSAHTLTGIPYLVMELDYDPDAFSGGVPMPSAVVRGAKVFDPRTSTTAWSQNPALLMRYVATSPLLGRQDAALVNDASIIAAANICEAATAYTINGQTHTRPLYTAGLVAKSGTQARSHLDDLAMAMAGRWVVIDGQLRVKAGAYSTPLQTLDETWLINSQAVQVQCGVQRSDLFNVVTGKFADETHDYQVLDYPRVESSSYITTDGAELPHDVQLNACTFAAQAQQVAACQMRDARYGTRITVLCNMRAYPVEVFDTITVNLSRFGMVGEVYEVLDVAWSIDGGIQLTLKQTGPAIWALGSSFSTAAAATSKGLRSPFELPEVASLAATSSGQMLQQSDGTLLNRIKATWAAPTDPAVLNAGGVEVRYGLATEPDENWQSIDATDGQAQLYLTGVRARRAYLIKARAFNSLVRGRWCLPVLHIVQGEATASGNLLSGSQWIPGTTGTQGAAPWRYLAQGDATEDRVELGLGPDGQTQPLWRCYSSDGASGPDGGWETDPCAINPLLAYRSTCWIYCAGTLDGDYHMGPGANTVNIIGGSVAANPYWATGARNTLPSGRWCLLVGYVLPSGYAGTQDQKGGVWDGVTGAKLWAGDDYKWMAGQATTTHRASMQAASAGALQYFTQPDFRVCDGTEPSISSLLAGAAMAAANAAAAAAGAAQGDATSALATIANMEADGVLTPVEKPDLIRDYAVITTEQSGIDSQATSYGITTEKTAYDTAVSDLTAYLGTLTAPVAWNSLSGNTTITGATLRTKFADAYTTRQTLLNAIAAAAGLRASWSGISGVGKPADNATKNTVSYSATAPGSPTDGDMWCDTSATPALWKARVAGAWQVAANYTPGALAMLNTVGTNQLDAESATVIRKNSVTVDTFSVPYSAGAAVQRVLCPVTITNPSSTRSGDLEISFTGLRTLTVGGSGGTGSSYHFIRVYRNGAFDFNFPDGTANPEDVNNLAPGNSRGWLQSYGRTITVAPSETILLESITTSTNSASGTTVTLKSQELAMRATLVLA